MSTVGRQGHESRLERLCDMPPATRCATIGATYRCIDLSSEGGKTMCSCASRVPTGCVTRDTEVFVGQSSGVLDHIRFRCRPSCNRVCCSSCSFFVTLAIGAATGYAKGYRGMPRWRSQDRVKVPDGRCHLWLCCTVCCNISMSHRSGPTLSLIHI